MINKIKNYFTGVVQELQKVTWPTKKEVFNHTIIVLVSAAIAIAITAAIDFGLTNLVQYLVQNK